MEAILPVAEEGHRRYKVVIRITLWGWSDIPVPSLIRGRQAAPLYDVPGLGGGKAQSGLGVRGGQGLPLVVSDEGRVAWDDSKVLLVGFHEVPLEFLDRTLGMGAFQIPARHPT